MTFPAREFVLTLSYRNKKGIGSAVSGLCVSATAHRVIADLDEGPIGPVGHRVPTHRHKTVVFK